MSMGITIMVWKSETLRTGFNVVMKIPKTVTKMFPDVLYMSGKLRTGLVLNLTEVSGSIRVNKITSSQDSVKFDHYRIPLEILGYTPNRTTDNIPVTIQQFNSAGTMKVSPVDTNQADERIPKAKSIDQIVPVVESPIAPPKPRTVVRRQQTSEPSTGMAALKERLIEQAISKGIEAAAGDPDKLAQLLKTIKDL